MQYAPEGRKRRRMDFTPQQDMLRNCEAENTELRHRMQQLTLEMERLHSEIRGYQKHLKETHKRLRELQIQSIRMIGGKLSTKQWIRDHERQIGRRDISLRRIFNQHRRT